MTKVIWFYSYKVSRVIKFMGAENRMVVAMVCKGGECGDNV